MTHLPITHDTFLNGLDDQRRARIKRAFERDVRNIAAQDKGIMLYHVCHICVRCGQLFSHSQGDWTQHRFHGQFINVCLV